MIPDRRLLGGAYLPSESTALLGLDSPGITLWARLGRVRRAGVVVLATLLSGLILVQHAAAEESVHQGGAVGQASSGPRRADPRDHGAYVLRGGQEEVVAGILAVDPGRSGGWALEGAGIEPSGIKARYVHVETGDRIEVELVRPPGTATEGLSLEGSDDLPASLAAALTESVDLHGEGLTWSGSSEARGRSPRQDPSEAARREAPGPSFPMGRPGVWLVVGLLVAVLLSALGRWKLGDARIDEGALVFGGGRDEQAGLEKRGATEEAGARPGYLPPPGRRFGLIDLVLLAALVTAGLGLRTIHLDARPMEPDEAAALGPVPGPTRWASEDSDARFKPPLYPQIIRLVTRQTSDLLAARSFSFAAGFATLILVFLVAWRRAGREAAIIAALLLALAAEALFVSQLARSYALLGLTVLLSHLALQRALARGGWSWQLYSAAAALALLTDYLALGPVLAEAAVVLLLPRTPWRVRAMMAVALGAALAMVSFVIPVTLPYLISGDGFSPMETIADGPMAALGIMARVLGGQLPFWGVAALVAGLGAGYILRSARRGARIDELCLIAAGIGVLAIALLGSNVESVRPRYVAHALPLFSIAFATALVRTPRALRVGLAVVLIGSQAYAVADRFVLGCTRHEVCANPPVPQLVEAMRSSIESGEVRALAIQPDGRVDDLLYRLFDSHGGPMSARAGEPFSTKDGSSPVLCPVAFCYPAGSVAVYGLDESMSLDPVLELHEEVLLFLDERHRATPPEGCTRLAEQDRIALLRCARP